MFNLSDWSKAENAFYEKIASVANAKYSLGLNRISIDIAKHTLAATHSVGTKGATLTTLLGYGNEVYAGLKGRDGYTEHYKDLLNNTAGIALGSWLTGKLGRAPNLYESTAGLSVLRGMGALLQGGYKADPKTAPATVDEALGAISMTETSKNDYRRELQRLFEANSKGILSFLADEELEVRNAIKDKYPNLDLEDISPRGLQAAVIKSLIPLGDIPDFQSVAYT